MEKYAIEIKTNIGWVNYHQIMRSGKERVNTILKEIKEKFPKANFRIVERRGRVVKN